MTSPFEYDLLEIVNGPEDGTQFPVTRTPVDIGSSTEAAVPIRFDHQIRARQARVTAVSDGYRVRRIEPGAVYVNGKRAGLLRSRIVREGGTVTVGKTDLVLRCAPAGLAGRSHGMALESDFTWTLRLLWRSLRHPLFGCGRILGKILRKVGIPVLIIVLVLGTVRVLRPSLLVTLGQILAYAWYYLRYFVHWISQLIGL